MTNTTQDNEQDIGYFIYDGGLDIGIKKHKFNITKAYLLMNYFF